ncbi:MAG: DUF3127 domain-containing protein [Bacteroidetes bacterium]|nr:DUF3127 domain-containing protein [Bacteroidota bacterium]
MNFETEGKILLELPSKEGTTKEGKKWVKKEYVMETTEQHPSKIRFFIFESEGKESLKLSAGDEVKVSFNIDCREYNGNWFNDIKAWKIEVKQ